MVSRQKNTQGGKNRAIMTFVCSLAVCLCLLCLSTISIFAYNVWTGCPDFMDIKAGYVQAFSGDINNPFKDEGIVENRHSLNTQQEKDENTGLQLSTIPNGEEKSIRLGNNNVGGEAEAIIYHFSVDPQNTLLFVNFAIVLEDPGHDEIIQPKFSIRVTDNKGTLVSDCAEYEVTAAPGIEGFHDYTGGYTAVRWRDWTKVGLDLTPYANQEVQVQLITYDCAAMGHFGYAYFTASCAPNRLEIEECGTSHYSISAPEGFKEYLWDNGDTTRTTTRAYSPDDQYLYCEVTSVTGCSFTQSAFVSSGDKESENHFKDTICQGMPYDQHHYDLPPQYNVGTTQYSNIIFNPKNCSEQTETFLDLTILQSFYNVEAAICEGDDYTENGFSILQPPVGTLFDTLKYKANNGCDSCICLKLVVSESSNVQNKIEGDLSPCTDEVVSYYVDTDNPATNYTWEIPGNAKVVAGSNSPQILLSFTDDQPCTIILKGENGCGTNAVPLKVKPRLSHHIFISDTLCEGDEYADYNFNVGKLTHKGYYTYTQKHQTTKGCDSTIVLALNVRERPSLTIETDPKKDILCKSEKITLLAKGATSSIVQHTCDSLPVAIGDIYLEDGTFIHPENYSPKAHNANNKKAPVGVAFYVHPDYQYALVADLKNVEDTPTLRWSTVSEDIPALTNSTSVRVVLGDHDGYSNTGIIRNQGDATAYPAAWAVDYENGWYIPSIGELRTLYGQIQKINPIILKIGGKTLLPDFTKTSGTYLSSTEFSADHYLAIRVGGEIIGNYKMYHINYIRPIKSVLLKITNNAKIKLGDVVENEFGEKGIAFHTDADGRSGWMLSAEPSYYEKMQYYAYFWGNTNDDVEGIVNYPYHERYLNDAEHLFAAERDFEGEENTKQLVAHNQGIENEELLATNTFDPTKGWFLPSVGQMNEIYSMLPMIDSSMYKNFGSEAMLSYATYWTSTEGDGNYAWAYDMAYGYATTYEKTNQFFARPISKFTLCEPHIEIKDSTLTYEWNNGEKGSTIVCTPFESTTYSVVGTTTEGCSINASKTLFVNQAENIELFDTICAGEHYQNEYFSVSESGIYTKEIKTDECNQKMVLHLTVRNQLEETKLKETICQGGTYNKNGFQIAANDCGLFFDTIHFSNLQGCDSLITLQLTVLPMHHDTIYARICQNESYFDNGFNVASYQNTGTHYFNRNVSDEGGCKSTLCLNLQVDSVYQLSMVDSICPNENYQKNGFDIRPQNEGVQQFFQNNQTNKGCDSIISLSLKVLHADETSYYDTILAGQTYESKDFILPVQTETGSRNFYRHLDNAIHCDSLITLHLYVKDDMSEVKTPTMFTPQNENGMNDVFMKGYEVYIYDRYGLLVTHSYDGWNGKYRGEWADPGVYVYHLIFKSGKEKNGTVEIFRHK